MREITEVKEVQEIALNILLYVHEICKQNNLKYFVSDGTLLGTIRHQGFIPWDDDIDIWMPRQDYKKIVNIINQDDSDYRVINTENTPDYVYPFPKVINTKTLLIENTDKTSDMGVYIDLFPYDGVPDGKKGDKHMKRAVFLFRQMIRSYRSLDTAKKRNHGNILRMYAVWLIRKLAGGKKLRKKVERHAQKYPVEGASRVACMCGGYKFHDIVDAKLCEEVLEYPFEKYMVNVPSGYHEILTNEYGDYMKLPPLEQRVSHHNFNAWWK